MCEDLKAGYAGAPAHAGLAFELEPGEKAWLAGPSASGRSALLETLAGVRKPLAGSLRWDGRSRPKIDDAKERIVLVRAEVIAGSVFDNLRLGNAALSTTEACEIPWEASAIRDLMIMGKRRRLGGLTLRPMGKTANSGTGMRW